MSERIPMVSNVIVTLGVRGAAPRALGPPPRIGVLGISATIKLPHSHLILHHVGRSDCLRLSEGACWFL